MRGLNQKIHGMRRKKPNKPTFFNEKKNQGYILKGFRLLYNILNWKVRRIFLTKNVPGCVLFYESLIFSNFSLLKNI